MITDSLRARARAWVNHQYNIAPVRPPALTDGTAMAVRVIAAHEALHEVRSDGLVYPYHDPVGYPTQGYGRLLSREAGARLDRWPPVTVQTAATWLRLDVNQSMRSVRRLTRVPLNEYQEAALASFVFNVGSGNYEISTLRRCINRGDYMAASRQFRRWVFAGGQELRGLKKRRAQECRLFLTSYPAAMLD